MQVHIQKEIPKKINTISMQVKYLRKWKDSMTLESVSIWESHIKKHFYALKL